MPHARARATTGIEHRVLVESLANPVAFCVNPDTLLGMNHLGFERTLSVTDATRKGVTRLVADAEAGASVVVTRRGQPAAVVVGVPRMRTILEREDDLRTAALVLARIATDSGERTPLDDVIAAFGFDRSELKAELDAEIAAGYGEARPNRGS